ncbi:hypothetical protein C348_01459 [Cryptococcus neoformans Gb118]|nr:hypothetical protein C350_01482 [Cryptococcus neoformans var. grubii MW-RSA36]OXL10552.1 hypothetical protein C348_01459 [Cryptococcus neoformans var. grubii Gb118]
MKSQPKTHLPGLHPQADRVPAYDPPDVLGRPHSHPHRGPMPYTCSQQPARPYAYAWEYDYPYYPHSQSLDRQLSLPLQLPPPLPYPAASSYPATCAANPTTNDINSANANKHGSTRQPTPPPPPPPASAPEPSAAGRTSELSGFQVDYTRVSPRKAVRRPRMVLQEEEEEVGRGVSVKTVILRKGADSQGIDHDQVGEIGPPPPEAYIVLRPHRVNLDGKVSGAGVGGGMGMGMGTTKGKGKYGKSIGTGASRKGKVDVGWDDGVPGDIPTFEQWSYELEVLQSPTRGRALGLNPLSRGFPSLSAPLIVQLIVRDGSGGIIPADNSALSRRLVHVVMMVDLVSADGKQSRGVVRVCAAGSGGEVGKVRGEEDGVESSYHLRNFLGGTFRLSSTFSQSRGKEKKRGEGRGKEKKNFFIFSEMVVRTPGEYALMVRLLDIAGPPHLGTSIGVTRSLAEVLTKPFTVFHSSKFPGSIPVTQLSVEFAKQGERNLGRKVRDAIAGSSEEDDG